VTLNYSPKYPVLGLSLCKESQILKDLLIKVFDELIKVIKSSPLHFILEFFTIGRKIPVFDRQKCKVRIKMRKI
jgi:hypothetical protein